MIDYFRRYGTLSPEAEAEILPHVQVVHKKKGSFLVKEGQTISCFLILRRGMVRAFYKKGDTDITIWFSIENENIAATACIYDQQPSREYIQCIEDCEFLVIAGEQMNILAHKYNDFNTIYRKITEEYCKIIENRLFIMQTMTASERYRLLLQQRPQLINRAPLGYIASYLGISQETLSRVRNAI